MTDAITGAAQPATEPRPNLDSAVVTEALRG
jgi:hypothetical protein